MIKIKFTEAEKKDLNYERYHHPHPRVQRKMEALWLKSQGESNKKIARLTGVTVNVVTKYIKEYKDGGIENVNYPVPRAQGVRRFHGAPRHPPEISFLVAESNSSLRQERREFLLVIKFQTSISKSINI